MLLTCLDTHYNEERQLKGVSRCSISVVSLFFVLCDALCLVHSSADRTSHSTGQKRQSVNNTGL